MKRIVYRIHWLAKASTWRIKRTGSIGLAGAGTQKQAVQMARENVKADVRAGNLAQIVLHGKDGRIRWERTYPRGSDPRRSKG